MIMLMILFLSGVARADVPSYWSHLTEIKDRHEFYKNDELISKPKDSWQLLFSVAYVDIKLKLLKDCVFYKVPGMELGLLKIKAIPDSEDCDDHMFKPGDKELSAVKSLHFSVTSSQLVVELTFPEYKTQKWIVKIDKIFVKPRPILNLSSAEVKSSKIIYLAPEKDVVVFKTDEFLKNGSACHKISDDCEEFTLSTCSKCENGWHEIPNGCDAGPKFCGQKNCGKKDAPACRRGMIWQRKDLKFDCRTDASFAYCSKGLKVACEGGLAYCR